MLVLSDTEVIYHDLGCFINSSALINNEQGLLQKMPLVSVSHQLEHARDVVKCILQTYFGRLLSDTKLTKYIIQLILCSDLAGDLSQEV